jgi:hypothetical protein
LPNPLWADAAAPGRKLHLSPPIEAESQRGTNTLNGMPRIEASCDFVLFLQSAIKDPILQADKDIDFQILKSVQYIFLRDSSKKIIVDREIDPTRSHPVPPSKDTSSL